MKDPVHAAKLREAIRRLGNPYAKLQTQETLEFEENLEQAAARAVPSAAAREYLRLLQDPYAVLSVYGEDGQPAQNEQATARPAFHTRDLQKSISQRGFETGCRVIFSQYIPAAEKGKIRAHHRDFITRNTSRSPQDRFKLLEELKKYDLSHIPGFQPQFNRERDDLTAAKLVEIERRALGNIT